MTLGCVDDTNGATDSIGGNCDYYGVGNINECGKWDNADFKANSMCCTCKSSGNL